MKNYEIKIIIGSDLVPTVSNENLFAEGKVTDLIGNELQKKLEESDIRIFNLEAPITYKDKPLDKCGPNLKINPKTIVGIKKINPSLLTLANNHIMDFQTAGLKETIDILKNHEIDFVGVGENLSTLKKTHIFNIKNKKIGVYVCAEHEFSIATKIKVGAVPFDLLDTIEEITKLNNECDYVIVLYHGGKEHYRYPSPNLKYNCNKMVEYGADLVICQHSHCIGCMENYRSGKIIYGQGNFIFDDDESEFWQTSLLVQIIINNDGVKIEYIPIVKKKNVIGLADNKKHQEILSDFNRRSEEILDEKIIEKKYKEFAMKNVKNYLHQISGLPKIIIKIDRYLFNGFFIKLLYRKKYKILIILNYIECEAHRELFIAGLKELLKDKG